MPPVNAGASLQSHEQQTCIPREPQQVCCLLAALLEVELHASAGSYQIFSSCLWEAGFAHTDPSILLPKADQDLFDTSASKATLALASALDKTCDSSCQVRFRPLPVHLCMREGML